MVEWEMLKRTVDLAIDKFINEARNKYVMPDDPEMKKGVRFRSNHRIKQHVLDKHMADILNGIHKTTDQYLKEAFDKMCELDWHYSNKEKWNE